VDFSFLTRRRLLTAGLGLGGLIAAGAGGLVALRGAAPAVAGLEILTPHEYRTLARLATVHLPAGGAFPVGADELDLARAFDGFLKDEPPQNIADLKKALTLLEYGPVIFERRVTTFSNLDDDARHAHWRSWIESDVLLQRQAATAFRKFLSLVFFDSPATWAHIGYPGPTVKG
jgi:hypothetical protein